MKRQFEQACNAEMLQQMGVTVLKKFNKESIPILKAWLQNDTIVEVNYPDITSKIVNLIVDNHAGKTKIDTQFESENYTFFNKNEQHYI